MQNNYISVDVLKTDKDRQEILACAANVANQMSGLGMSIVKLENNWAGSANDAFLRSLEEDYELMKQLLTEIGEFAEARREAEIEYIQTEYEVSARIDYLGV